MGAAPRNVGAAVYQQGKTGEIMSGGRSKSSGRWLREHADDVHVRQALIDGYRSRAVYKLIELDEKDALLGPGMTVLELGAAPGGWTQYLSRRLGDAGHLVASDILPMDALEDVLFIQGDFTEAAVAEALEAAIGPAGADLVLSDMAPNLSGVSTSDQARAIALAELALHSATALLNSDGVFVVKVFQGEGFDPFVRELRNSFHSVRVRKPAASRARSREVYLVARKLTG